LSGLRVVPPTWGSTADGIRRETSCITILLNLTVNTRNKTTEDVQNELEDLTGRREVDAALGRGDIVGRAVVIYD
jgi:hypothetical protein